MAGTRLFKCGFALLAWLSVALLLAGCPAPDEPGGGKLDADLKPVVYSGAWFEVAYPVKFTVRPSLPSSTAEGYDSAEFVSSDETVSFYVFAPQWGGVASDIALVPERERLVSEKRSKSGDREIRWFTIAAKDGSYSRSYMEEVAQQDSVKTIVGIKYRDEKARESYMKDYERFRESLKQYAD